MTLLFIDGFDSYAAADITKKWNTADTPTMSGTSGRRGGGGLFYGGNASGASKVLPSNISTVVFGCAFKIAVLGIGNGIFKFMDTSVNHVIVGVNADGSISACRANTSTVLGTTALGLISSNTYNYIEIKTTIHDTTGSVTIKLNGAQVLNLTNVDTRNGGNSTLNTVRVQSPASSADVTFDDLYICDTAGSTNNDFLGDVRVDTIMPNGDGNYTQFTPSTGTTHYTLVDESTPNTTDYNDGSTVGDRDSYTLGNLSALTSQTIYGVQVNAAINKDDAGSKSAATFVRSNGTNGDGATAVLGTSQVYVSQIYETNPDGAVAWTESTVNAMEAGVVVIA